MSGPDDFHMVSRNARSYTQKVRIIIPAANLINAQQNETTSVVL